MGSNHSLMLHCTSKLDAENLQKIGVMKDCFRPGAFGQGFNCVKWYNIAHLRHYLSSKKCAIVFCWVNCNVLVKNKSYYDDINCTESQKYLEKHGHTRPEIETIPIGADGLCWNHIYVMRSESVHVLGYFQFLL